LSSLRALRVAWRVGGLAPHCVASDAITTTCAIMPGPPSWRTWADYFRAFLTTKRPCAVGHACCTPCPPHPLWCSTTERRSTRMADTHDQRSEAATEGRPTPAEAVTSEARSNSPVATGGQAAHPDHHPDPPPGPPPGTPPTPSTAEPPPHPWRKLLLLAAAVCRSPLTCTTRSRPRGRTPGRSCGRTTHFRKAPRTPGREFGEPGA
jgi:hypothetical protein